MKQFFCVVLLAAVIVLAFIAVMFGPGRYQIQTVTFMTRTYSLSSGAGSWDHKACVKIDRLTGRTWILEGKHLTEHDDKRFREIITK